MTFLTHKFDIYVLCKLYSYPLKRQGMTIKIWKSTFKNFKVTFYLINWRDQKIYGKSITSISNLYNPNFKDYLIWFKTIAYRSHKWTSKTWKSSDLLNDIN